MGEMTPIVAPRVYSVASLAERWGVSPGTVYNMINAGRLATFGFGGKMYRIRAEEVERFECQTNTPCRDTEISTPLSGATKADDTGIRLERLIDRQPKRSRATSGSDDPAAPPSTQ